MTTDITIGKLKVKNFEQVIKKKYMEDPTGV